MGNFSNNQCQIILGLFNFHHSFLSPKGKRDYITTRNQIYELPQEFLHDLTYDLKILEDFKKISKM